MLLKNLCEMRGVSGDEDRVRLFIIEQAKSICKKVRIDRLGNVFAYKKGSSRSGITILLCAHMDEVGFIISSITDKGYLKFKTVGGIDNRILLSQKVLIGDNRVSGVIGIKAIHLCLPHEKEKVIIADDMYIDIGAQSKQQAEAMVSVGDYATFDSKYIEFGDNLIKAKALDNRAGCAVLLELMERNYPVNIIFCFTVQEEIGLRGAFAAGYDVKADYAIIIETTTCSDVPGSEPHMYNTICGKGPAFTVMDRTSIANSEIREYLAALASGLNIPFQYKQTAFGGNDAGAIQSARDGFKVCGISIPCRYIHSPVSVISKNDYDNTKKLLIAYLNNNAHAEYSAMFASKH